MQAPEGTSVFQLQKETAFALKNQDELKSKHEKKIREMREEDSNKVEKEIVEP